MFERFELNIICYITIKFFYFVSCSLHFRCVIDKVLVGLTFGAMKLRITTDQETSLNLVESKLHLVGSNRIIITKELHGWGWRLWWCWVGGLGCAIFIFIHTFKCCWVGGLLYDVCSLNKAYIISPAASGYLTGQALQCKWQVRICFQKYLFK